MAKMRVVQVPQPRVPFELVEREVPEPSAGSVRIKVQPAISAISIATPKTVWYPAFNIRGCQAMK
jgi:NADPH:quinone reductase-like Zn-dependent oxidoreductase